MRQIIPIVLWSGLFGGTHWAVTIDELEHNRQLSVEQGKHYKGWAFTPKELFVVAGFLGSVRTSSRRVG